MSEVVPLYRPKLKQEWRVSLSRKHRTVGGLPGKCQSRSQEIVQPDTRAAVEGCPEAQPVGEGYPGGGETPPAPVESVGEGVASVGAGAPCVAGGAVVSGTVPSPAVGAGASCPVAGSTPEAGGAVSAGGASSAVPAGATGASVSAGRPPAAGRPGRRTSM